MAQHRARRLQRIALAGMAREQGVAEIGMRQRGAVHQPGIAQPGAVAAPLDRVHAVAMPFVAHHRPVADAVPRLFQGPHPAVADVAVEARLVEQLQHRRGIAVVVAQQAQAQSFGFYQHCLARRGRCMQGRSTQAWAQASAGG